MDTTKATTLPTSKQVISIPVKSKPNFTSLSRLAPNITGIARKKVYSEATFLDTPISSAPTMVAPEREVPGKMTASTWNTPIKAAVW